MLDSIGGMLWASWRITAEASAYLLFGFLMAGALHVLLPPDLISRRLGGRGPGSALGAALIGAPLPLCSCGVLPAAIGLRRNGAGPGATLSFLISTPETGVDSVSISMALLDPILTVARPVAAVLTAMTAGLIANLFPEPEPAPEPEPDCGCRPAPSTPGTATAPGVLHKLGAVFRYGFAELMRDIGRWLITGLLIAGAITHFMPVEWLETAGSGPASLFIMLAAGIPLYICATSSTPMAASLIAKGLSPGAALVFLLAGPATNAAALTLIYREMGARITAVYLGSIAAVGLLCGALVNALYARLQLAPMFTMGTAAELVPPTVQNLGGAVLLLLIGLSLLPVLPGGGNNRRGTCRS